MGVVLANTKSDEQIALENSYVAWMKALKEALGGHQRKIYPLFLEVFLKGTAEREYFKTDNGKKVFDSWFREPKGVKGPRLPTGPSAPVIDKKLGELAKVHVSEAPDGALPDLALWDVINRLRSTRDANKPQVRKLERAAHALYESRSVTYPITKVIELDEINLQLGSSVFGGELPTYCRRDVDEQLAQALNDPNRDIVILIGPYKSGKTRSLIHALKNSQLSDNPVLWLDRFGDISKVAQTLHEESFVDPVVVIDDLQKFAFEGPEAISRQSFQGLLKAKKIVGTLYSGTAESWREAYYDKSLLQEVVSNPAEEIKKKILDAGIELSFSLSAEELILANAIFTAVEKKSDLQHLASFFSASELLLSRARKILNGENPYDFAFLETLINAKILWPSGVGIEDLKLLFDRELKKTNSLWLESEWERVVRDFARGVAAKSPHAIMVRAATDRDEFELFDGIWSKLRPENWCWNHTQQDFSLSVGEIVQIGFSGYPRECLRVLTNVDPSPDGLSDYYLGYFYSEQNEIDLAEKHYLAAMNKGDKDAACDLGALFYRLERYRDAEEYFLQAVADGHTDALNSLGFVYKNLERYPEAEDYFQRAIDAGDSNALRGMGLLNEYLGRSKEAEKYYKKAIQAGDKVSFGLLGWKYFLQNRFEEAETILLEGVDAEGSTSAAHLAFLYIETNRYEDAEKYSLLAKEAGAPRNLIFLGSIYYNLGRFEEAEAQYLEDISHGVKEALENIAALYEETGRTDDAVRYYLEAIDAGMTSSLRPLAFIYGETSRPDDAEKYYRKAIDTGDIPSLDLLARLFARVMRFDEAEEYFIKSKEAGNKDSLVALASLYLFQKRGEEMERCYLEVVGDGIQENFVGIGFLAQNLGRFDEAEDHYKKAIENGEKDARFALGSLFYDLGRLKDAENEFLKADEEGVGTGVSVSLAMLYGELGQLNDAEKYYVKATDEDIDSIFSIDDDANARVLNGLGLLCRQLERIDEAENYFLRAIDLDNNEALLEIAELYKSQDRYPEAEKYLRMYEDRSGARDNFAD